MLVNLCSPLQAPRFLIFILNVRGSQVLDETLWRSRFFGVCPEDPRSMSRKSFGCNVLGESVKFKHRSEATKCFRLVRSRCRSGVKSSSDCENAGDKRRLHFVPFSRFSRKKERISPQRTQRARRRKLLSADVADGTQMNWTNGNLMGPLSSIALSVRICGHLWTNGFVRQRIPIPDSFL
jgi:hypothetical protein